MMNLPRRGMINVYNVFSNIEQYYYIKPWNDWILLTCIVVLVTYCCFLCPTPLANDITRGYDEDIRLWWQGFSICRFGGKDLAFPDAKFSPNQHAYEYDRIVVFRRHLYSRKGALHNVTDTLLHSRNFNPSPPGQNGRHFADDICMHFREWIVLYCNWNFTKDCYWVSNWQQRNIGLDTGLAPNRRQAIIRTNAYPIH